jgi:3-deoxy-D-manno-octulosonic-acid transferase
MVKLLYNTGIHLYTAAIRVAAMFNPKAKLWVEGRRNLFEKMEQTISSGEPLIWFHAASLGEFEQGRPVIEDIRKKFPQHKILLTFFSPSGYEIRKNYAGADYIFYLPADTRANVRRFLAIAKPQMAFFIKYEYWLNFLNALQINNIPTYLFSAIFRPDQIFFRWYGALFLNALKSYKHIFVQNNESKILLENAGIESVTVSGDTRFDRVAAIASTVKHLQLVVDFVGKNPVFIAGSTWPADEQLIAQYIKSSNNSFKTILAPHEIEKEHLDFICNLLPNRLLRYSQAEGKNLADYDILLIDNIGMLSSLYQYGTVSYIGGGFGKGIHNTLEAATFGLPVLFGPNYQKFSEAKQLIALGAAFTFETNDQLTNLLDKLFADKELCHNAGDAARNFVQNNTGASRTILNSL